MVKPSSKVIAGKGNSAKSVRSCPVPDTQYGSVSVRKISNGYVISESTEGPKGYRHSETFSATKPKITMPSAAISKAKK